MNNAIVKSFDDAFSVAKAMAASNYFQDSKDASKALVKILAGQEIGMGPFASMTGIHIIQGKPVMGANVIATIIKNDPRYDYRVLKLEDDGCELAFYQDGKEVGRSGFNKEDAKAAGLLNKDNWHKYPRNMYFARAISNGARWHTPGVFGGAPVYTPDEFDLDVDEDGMVIDSVAEDVTEKPDPEQIVKELGYEPKKKNGNGRSWSAELVEAVVSTDTVEHPKHAVMVLNLSNLDPKTATPEQAAQFAKYYRGHRDAGVDEETASALANEGEAP